MSITLCRIDERLLHGQVLVGWGGRLGIDRYLVIDDELAASVWEQDLYASGTPQGCETIFLSVEEGLARFADIDNQSGCGALLTRDTATMRRLAEAGLLEGRRVNIGGLHEGPDRRRVLDYVYLGPSEIDDLREIAAHASQVTARDLPTSPAVSFSELIDAAERP